MRPAVVSWRDVSSRAGAREPLPAWLRLWLGVAVALRLAYHARYFGEDPFALATFSDGRVYETMARDILAHPPWGSEPFYLQGIYGYVLAFGLALRSQPSLALVLQLAIMAVAWWGFYRALQVVTDRRGAALATAILLSYPGLSFYENKYLTAALACASFAAMLAAFAALVRRPAPWATLALGAATGLAILLRSNVLVAVPIVAWAAISLVRVKGGPSWPRTLAAYALGLGLVLSPMAWRNAVVTGDPTVLPAHGGGTSFYIGNNAEARGLWNDAGGLLSGDVAHERQELSRRLGLGATPDAELPAEIGRALYRRAWAEIRAEPGAWLWLEARKAWLMLGNDELSQDYDVLGERELVGAAMHVGLPFGVLLALFGAAVVGAWGRERDAVGRAWTWLCAGQALAVLAANLLFFTSAQHRVPIVVPLVAWVAWARPDLAFLAGSRRRRTAMLAVTLGLLAMSAWPRSRQTEPTAVHHFNLAIAQKDIGDPRGAMQSLDRAVQARPDHAVIRIERATLARELGDFGKARADLAALAERTDLPAWVRARAAGERARVRALEPAPAPH